MTGPSNDIPYYICPFRVEETTQMYQHIGQLINALELKQIKVLEINLYRLCIEHFSALGVLDGFIADETMTPRNTFFNSISGLTDPREFIAPLIINLIKRVMPDIIFITGVGEVYPYLRTHKLLSTLESKFTEKPLVLFFPGKYETDNVKGSNLTLFGILDDRYYRAFNIYHCEP
ncbi:hypothetical protein DSECCO2_646940 [anaerobic digester metagenome]